MKTRIFTTLAFMLFLTTLNAANEFNKRNFTVEHGLSSMFVLSLMQDNDGYMWAATVDGLNQIRNRSIKIYGAGNNCTSQLSGNLIEQVDQTTDGIMWVHTKGLTASTRTRTESIISGNSTAPTAMPCLKKETWL